ncbi:MAG: type II toxin-antitoxin system RelE/ParE family toxin [Mariniphaga sp.]|nr:type II toxin-antitoxin system RelE/ParE family toxin [Mariniphaga sp.]
MAKRRIIWSHRARITLYRILKFFADRNRSKVYSAKLYKKIIQEIQILEKYPNIGIQTDIENVRGLISGYYIIYYEITEREIVIHAIWDSRRNPDDLKIKG